MLAYLHIVGCPVVIDAVHAAAGHDNLECLEFLHDVSCPWDARTSTTAIHCGSVACLQYLYEHGCPWSSNALLYESVRTQVMQGHNVPKFLTTESLQKLSWCLVHAAEHGCRYTAAESYYMAASVGVLDFVKYLRGKEME